MMKTLDYTINARGNRKQFECIKAWLNPQTEEILYGGAKGGGKSFIGCSLILNDAFCYPQTHYFIARKQLNDLRKFTTASIFEVLSAWNIPAQAYKYNGQDNYFELYNGSKIFLLDCKYLPSDPQYQRLGSMQMTRGWIEEGGEFDYDSYANLKISIGRWKNDVYNLSNKLLITANPSKNFLYKEFYIKQKEGNLEEWKAFIQALPYDNKKLPKAYIENLERTLKGAEKKRLLQGLWEYDDDPTALCQYDKILEIFKNDHISVISGQELVNSPNHQSLNTNRYITADIARFGSDLAVVGVWRGFELFEIHSFEISKTTEIQALIKHLQAKYQIPKSHCVADEDGVGGGVVDNLDIQGFVNNAKPLEEQGEKPNYKNLQTQCLYKLAEKINRNELYISAPISEKQQTMIIEELEQIKSDNSDNNKLSVINKSEVKQKIGRSPDYRDMLLMRLYFELKPRPTFRAIFR